MPVSLILGANDMYDVIKFRVAITEKKVPALIVAKTCLLYTSFRLSAAEGQKDFNLYELVPSTTSAVFVTCLLYTSQVEEEATAQGIVDKIKKAGDTGIFFVDSQLGQR